MISKLLYTASETALRSALKSNLSVVAQWLVLMIFLGGCASSSFTGDDTKAQGVFFLQSGKLEPSYHPMAWNLPAKVLRDDLNTGLALEIHIPADAASGPAISADRDLEFFVLTGDLWLGGHPFSNGDYVRVPANAQLNQPRSLAGATLLLFSVAGYPTPVVSSASAAQNPASLTIVRSDDAPWVGGTAMKAAGRDDVPLKIKHFRRDPQTGARTYLVAVGAGLAIPWETHTVAEEGYLIQGDYVLPECFPSGLQSARYQPGGYFYRPAGIAHNGPESGSSKGAVMLVRTPEPLTVTLVDGCNP